MAVLLVLIIVVGVSYFATREAGVPHAQGKGSVANQAPLVDEKPLPTARALAPLALTPDERRFAEEAARIADHEVDLAFADALRQAVAQRPADDPKNRDLYLKMQNAQVALTDVLARIEQVKAKLAVAKPTEKDALQDQKDLLDAEQALDEDEIEDAQQELIRTGGDQETAIQRQRDQHEAGEHDLEQRQAQAPGTTAPTVNLSASNLAEQVHAWMWLRDKQVQLEAARTQAEEIGNNLAQQHQTLQSRVHGQKSQREDTKQRAADLRTGAAGKASREDTTTTVNSLKRFQATRSWSPASTSGYRMRWNCGRSMATGSM